jgi:hypothetical protein
MYVDINICTGPIYVYMLQYVLEEQKRPTRGTKETYWSYICVYVTICAGPLFASKRDPLECQTRPITVSKETYWSYICVYVTICAGPLLASKRDPLECQKRPIRVSKETH